MSAPRYAKGMPRRRIILRHALRNALVPVVTLGALEFGQLLGGSVLTEYVFSVPGIGKLLVDSVFNRDYPVVQAVVLCSGAIYIALNLLADIAYVVPRPPHPAREVGMSARAETIAAHDGPLAHSSGGHFAGRVGLILVAFFVADGGDGAAARPL